MPCPWTTEGLDRSGRVANQGGKAACAVSWEAHHQGLFVALPLLGWDEVKLLRQMVSLRHRRDSGTCAKWPRNLEDQRYRPVVGSPIAVRPPLQHKLEKPLSELLCAEDLQI